MTIRTLAAVSLLATAPAFAGGPSPSVFAAPATTHEAGPGRAVSAWGVAPQGRRVVVQLECSPPVRQGRGHQVADATLLLTGHKKVGPVSTRVLCREDRTDHRSYQDKACVSAAVSGAGVAYFEVEVRIEDRNCPAGNYNATVAATLTAP